MRMYVYPKAEFKCNSWSTTSAFDVESNYALNAELPNPISREGYTRLRDEILEKVKQIAVENGPKTAFGEVDKYLASIDAVKELGLKKA